MAPPAVELRQVSKSYREGEAERVVLRDVSVTIARGEIVVLVGRSGSGKSTLLNVIAGIDRPSAGTVVVDGTDLTALDEQARTRFRRRHIGFVFQFYNLIPLLTVEENLMLPLDLNNRADAKRSEEHTSELQSPCISYAVFCLKKKTETRVNAWKLLRLRVQSPKEENRCNRLVVKQRG